MGKVKCVLQIAAPQNPWDGLGTGFSPSKVMPRDARSHRADVSSLFPHFFLLFHLSPFF